jgi:hypothetical protein
MTSKKDKFVEARARGLSRREAAAEAGASKDGSGLDKLPSVQEELARIRLQMAANSGVTKEVIIQGLVDAANMAQVMADPQGMVAAWRELGKMLGHYAPEVKKVEQGINKRDLLAALDQLSDEELLRISGGKVINGEFKRVEDAEEVPQLPSLGAGS